MAARAKEELHTSGGQEKKKKKNAGGKGSGPAPKSMRRFKTTEKL